MAIYERLVDTLNTLPSLPDGYVMHPAALDDLPEAVEMFNACSRALTGKDEFTLERYRSEWLVPGVNLDTDIRVVLSPAGRIVGCMEFWDLAGPHVRYNVWGRVHPEHQGRGIASALLHWAERRGLQSIPRAPDDARISMMGWLAGEDAAAHRVYEAAGFNLIRHSWRMKIELDAPPPAPVWPAGITVRAYVPGQDERATLTCERESFRDHWGYLERPFEQDLKMFEHFVNNMQDFDPALFFLAMDGDQVVGISLCDPRAHDDADMGWVDTLGVLRSHRRRGLGLALLQHTFGEFYRRGTRKVGLGVDASSLTGATRLYERAGMHVYRQFRTYEKELRQGADLSTQAIE